MWLIIGEKDEVKKSITSQCYKRGAHITKQRILFHNILYNVSNPHSVTENTDDYIDSALQDIITLSYDTSKDALFHLGGKIRFFPDLKKKMVAVHTTKRRGKDTI